jgi:hypothetical protein
VTAGHEPAGQDHHHSVALGGLRHLGIALGELRRRCLPLRVRTAAEPDGARFLDAALRAMATGLRRTSLPTPTVQAVLLGPTDLEVLLQEPTEAAPPPFTLAADGHRWTLPCHIPVPHLEAIAGDAVAPLPGLVTLGFSGAGQLLVNLEAPGLTALVGDPTATRPLLDAMAAELAAAASSDPAQVLLVGFGSEPDHLEQMQHVERLDGVLPDLERQTQAAAELVDKAQVGSALAGRLAGDDADAWRPTIVLVAQPPSSASLERLATVTANPRRSPVVAVVAGDGAQAAWHLEVADGQVRVPALDLVVRVGRRGVPLGVLWQRCEAKLQELDLNLPVPTIEAFCDAVGAALGRRIELRPADTPVGMCGLWVEYPDCDLFYYERATTPWHQALILGHEIGHLVFGHRSAKATREVLAKLLGLDVRLVQGVLARTSPYTDDEECLADVFGTLVASRAVRAVVPAQQPTDPAAAEVLDRLRASLTSGGR